MVAVAARLYLGERLRRVQWLGVGVSALGVLVILTRGRLAALRSLGSAGVGLLGHGSVSSHDQNGLPSTEWRILGMKSCFRFSHS